MKTGDVHKDFKEVRDLSDRHLDGVEYFRKEKQLEQDPKVRTEKRPVTMSSQIQQTVCPYLM